LRNEAKNLNLHRYPFISPCTTAIGVLKGIRPKGYVRQLLFDIVYMRSDMRRANSQKVNYIKDYAYYAVIKRTTQNMLAILRVDYCVGRNGPEDEDVKDFAQLTIYDEWTTCNPKILAPLMQNIAEVITMRYIELGIKLDEVCVASQTEKIPEMIYDNAIAYGFGILNKPIYVSVSEGTLNDRDELGYIPYCCIDIEEEGLKTHEK
ncbi:MAG: hypothetical protein NC131_14665, partial [Roseburia sp.]|nr:hypothetical protein [Roseburia sp.]